ncbi:hypothetical protein B1M_17712, partial [Burkholderia sp. TJI49]
PTRPARRGANPARTRTAARASGYGQAIDAAPPDPAYPSRALPAYLPQPPAGYAQNAAVGAPAPRAAMANADVQMLDVASELAQVNREQASTVSGG